MSSSGDGQGWNHRTRAILALEEARKFVLAWCSNKYVYLTTRPEPEPESAMSSHEESDVEF